MEPLVSVIIPVYRTEEYLVECVESVRKQTYSRLEIILVDDGSPDGAPAMCDEYASVDPRICVIHKENGGLSDARNVGKAAATGEYLTFLDSDDILAPETVEYMLKLAREENAQVVKIGVIRKYHPEQCVTVLKEERQVVTGYEAINRIFWDNSQIITTCGKLFDAELFRGLDFPEGLYYEDEYTTPRIYHRASTVVLSNSELYFYMQRDNDSILRGALNRKRIRDSVFVTEDRIDFLRSVGYKKMVSKAVKDHYIKLVRLEASAAGVPELEESCRWLRQKRKELIRQYPLPIFGTKTKQVLFRIKSRLMG